MSLPATLQAVRAARGACCLAASVIVGGCAAVGPTYRAPTPPLPASWRAVVPHDGRLDRLADWWSRFDDPALARLVRWAEDDSPSLALAAANIDAARATLAADRARGLPQASANASVTRSRQALGDLATTENLRSTGLDASWEIDLFGKLHRTREAARARFDARQADWHEARVTLAADTADTYVQYRAGRLLESADASDLASQRETLRVTQSAVRAGLSASADLELAEANAASAESTLAAQTAECDGLVKSLVALTGVDEPALRPVIDARIDTHAGTRGDTHSDARGDGLPTPAAFTVASVPADVLRQRPDVAAAERELAARSAEIGQAEADRYPSFSLGGTIALSASTTTWSFGPSLSVPLFDGGQRRAAVDAAQAAYDAALANHRSTVRTAVKEVEQALVSLQGAASRSESAQRAAVRYRRYVNATEINWRAGGTDLLSLEIARRSAIAAETSLITLERDRVRDWIALYKALGGGWQAPARDESTASTESRP